MHGARKSPWCKQRRLAVRHRRTEAAASGQLASSGLPTLWHGVPPPRLAHSPAPTGPLHGASAKVRGWTSRTGKRLSRARAGDHGDAREAPGRAQRAARRHLGLRHGQRRNRPSRRHRCRQHPTTPMAPLRALALPRPSPHRTDLTGTGRDCPIQAKFSTVVARTILVRSELIVLYREEGHPVSDARPSGGKERLRGNGWLSLRKPPEHRGAECQPAGARQPRARFGGEHGRISGSRSRRVEGVCPSARRRHFRNVMSVVYATIVENLLGIDTNMFSPPSEVSSPWRRRADERALKRAPPRLHSPTPCATLKVARSSTEGRR